MKYLAPFFFFIAIFFSCDRASISDEANSSVKVLFRLMPGEQTNIDFVNRVADEEFFNILTYRNFYNGGGVGLGDINNDSLPDIFLISNMGKNKLYLNKGDFTFEDISAKAGIEGTKSWSTGVTMADVNADGWLDIYVCNSGNVKGDDRENELFINNKDLTFAESAAIFNLDNKGLSTHASFFDYDLDGDLDCFILNNSFIDPGKIELYKDVRTEVDDLGGDKLYRNDGNTFTDVTTEAGIYSSKIGFGLGVSVSDINNDFLPDIYISNDFWERDYLYINQGNGRFKEQLPDLLSICSVSSMGADIADVNNDGNPEIFTTDMLPGDNYRLKAMTMFDNFVLEDIKIRASYHYQILQNCLHLNNGNLNFQEIASLSGVAATDWSWGALIFDFENDGLKDIFVSNGITKDIMYVDFTDFIADKDNVKKIVTQKGRFDWRDFTPHIPSNPLESYAFVNNGNLKFTNKSRELGLGTPSFSNGAAYGDLDNDGDLDLVVNNVNKPCFIYRNESEKVKANNYLKIRFKGGDKNPFGVGAMATVFYGDQKQVLQNFPARGFQSSVEPCLNFGLGKIPKADSVVIVWPDKKLQRLKDVSLNAVLAVDYKDVLTATSPTNNGKMKTSFQDVTSKLGLSKASHRENLYNDFNHEQLLLRMLSTEGPRLITGDINNDKRDDFVLLGGKNDPDKLFIQKADGSFLEMNAPVINADSAFESTCGVLVDLNNDGDQDLVIGSGGNEYQRDSKYFLLRIYRNDGNGNFKRETEQHLPDVIGTFSCMAAHDFDQDGFTDLFLGSRVVPGSYGLIPRSFLLKNERGTLINYTPRILGGVGMVTDAIWTDFDGDGDKDLMIVGDWMPVTLFVNDQGDLKEGIQVPRSSGWWNRVAAADLDGDGDDDYVLGNWGQNIKFRASPAKPLTMYVKDFDNNGKSEFVINWYPPLDDAAYPFATKHEINQQIPFLKKSNLRYEDYAHKTYETLMSEQVRSGAIAYKTEVLESVIAWNEKGALDFKPLPLEAQVSPVFGICITDFDKDSIQDIWLGGNFFGLKPQVGRCNSSKGVYLKGTGNRNFVSRPSVETGIFVEGEVRDATTIKVRNQAVMMVARNNASVKAFRKSD